MPLQPAPVADGAKRDQDRARVIEGLGRALRQPWRLNQAIRLSIDAFAVRYASSHGLVHELQGETPPATWFLESVVPEKSHSFISGLLAGRAEGVLFYVERAVRVSRGQVMEGWTVALYQLPEAQRLAYGIACLWRPGAVWGGRLKLNRTLPQGLIELAIGDASLDERYRVAVSSDADRPGVDRLFTADFVAWINTLPWQPTGEEVVRFELRNGVLCVYVKDKCRTTASLDAFCERGALIAAQVQRVSG